MALLLNTQGLAKSYGAAFLFRNVSLSIQEGDRVGLIGPNGSGKSTLLEILAQRREADSGEVSVRKGTRLAYLPQESQFAPGVTVREVIRRSLKSGGIPEAEWQAREGETLGRAGFEDFDVEAATLSGGWRKRLGIAEVLVQNPGIVLLDEPTNHLDLGGIEWLEKLLQNAPFASVIVSHDRYFLENVPTAVAELNRAYPDGLLYVAGNYSAFLEKKADFLHAQAKRQDALENRVRTEIEWLRRGPKARASKAKARIDTAQEMIGELADLRARSRTSATDIDFAGTERKTKRLIHLEGVSYGYDGRTLFENLDFTITAGMRVGLVGSNGSGKTTLLRLLRGEMKPLRGVVERADGLRMVYFDQNRTLDPKLTLRRALAPDSDSVIYRERVIHVASWADRFLFTSEQLNQPVGRLSGGERARVLIANLMLEPADVLLLDEPTNDLDIPTLEILEESLLEFSGALVLVTHDRYLLDRVSTLVLGLDGRGGAERFADYSQWDVWRGERAQPKARAEKEVRAPAAAGKKKPSYLEAREYEGIERRVHEAEQVLEQKRAALQDPAITKDGRLLEQAYREVEEAQAAVDAIYERWAELERRML
ncbi:MAG TPA: ABC-F family ATP-binding cassette domain-containing protein [Bryobacteraceae bacterium]|nr:ABC-F family ATP-binding cassette domain-containing protein [Bryobacteraceae bacterium]